MYPDDTYETKKKSPAKTHPQNVIGKLSCPVTSLFNTTLTLYNVYM